jgi:hypothetical protein
MLSKEIIHKHFPAFTKIIFTYEPSKGAARSSLKNGSVIINNSKCTNMPLEHIFFILCHEEGHIVLNTKDELEADRYAFAKYEKYNFDNSATVQVLHQHLDHTNEVHKARLFAQYQRALENDYKEKKINSAYRKKYYSVADVKRRLKEILNK